MPTNGIESQTILLVEDFEDSRYMIKRMLELSGECSVLEAINGEEAFEQVRRDCPDLILMDLNLPQMDGLTLARLIRESEGGCREVPIIALTAHDTYGMREAAIEAGCNAYLTKPIDFDELERVIRQTLSGW